jgi:hypothetical protein
VKVGSVDTPVAPSAGPVSVGAPGMVPNTSSVTFVVFGSAPVAVPLIAIG